MTSRYEELAKLAIEDSRAFFEESWACSDCAAAAHSKLIEHLQAPPDAIRFVALNQEYRPVGEELDKPELKFCADDGAWHFGIRIHLGVKNTLSYARVLLAMRIQPDGQRHLIHFDRDFSVDLKNPDSFTSFADYVYISILGDYGKPRRTRRKQIGFPAGT